MIPHTGNQCPVFPDVLVRVQLNGDTPGLARIGRADEFNWRTVDFADPEVHANRILAWESHEAVIPAEPNRDFFSAPELLRAAEHHMLDRAATYDKPEGERSMAATVKVFTLITGRELRESEGWLFMEILKLVRSEQCAEPHRDSIEDNVAYAALYGEARLGGR